MNRTVFWALVKRNVKMFFRDKGMFLVSLITPLILLLLYVTFLGNVYRDAFTSALPGGSTLPDKLINGCVSAQLVSSVLSVSAVTVAFCSNMLMVQDRANGTIWDLTVTPVNPGILGGAYFTATFISTLLINLIAAVGGLVYMGITGWYMSAYDVVLLLCDIVITVLFGTAASSVVNFFLSSQGQISAVGTVVSSCYGFVSGAYMPISSFSEGLRNVISVLPGTYGTSLIRTHSMAGAFREMEAIGLPRAYISGMKDAVDSNIYFFGSAVETWTKYAVVLGAAAVLIGIYILLNRFRSKRKG
ncbi:MAG: ABC transporter permease [Clostridia bacterium]|nr:ABC transporter permease [Clostridia bacterium]